MTKSRSKPEQDGLKALRKWEKDTGSPASATEGNAFIDGFLAGRKLATAIPASQKPKVFIIEYESLAAKGWARSLHYSNVYTEKEADAIISGITCRMNYRKREIEYA